MLFGRGDVSEDVPVSGERRRLCQPEPQPRFRNAPLPAAGGSARRGRLAPSSCRWGASREDETADGSPAPRHPRGSWPARDGEVVLCGNTFRLVQRWFVKCPICKAPCLPQDAPSPGRNKPTPCGAQPWVDVKRVLKPRRGHQVTGGSESGVWRGPDAGDFPRALPPPPVFGER